MWSDIGIICEADYLSVRIKLHYNVRLDRSVIFTNTRCRRKFVVGINEKQDDVKL